jgi:O-antigen/teichoic acid export membrane protein
MKVDSTHHGCDYTTERSSVAAVAARRFRGLADRFPSASQSLLSIFDQAIVSGTSFVMAAMIGRATSPTELGLYYLVLSIIFVITGAQEQIVAAPYIVYSKRRRGEELAEYSGSMWQHHFAMTLVVVAGLLVAIGLVSITGPSEIMPGLWALLCATPLLLLRQAIRRFTFVQLQLKSAIALDAAVSAMQLGGVILLIYFERLTLLSIFAVMGAACAVAAVGWYRLDPPHSRMVGKRFLPDLRHNWSFGKWALQSYLVGQTTPQVMLWILSVTGGTAATGVLGACSTLIGVTNVPLFGLDNVLTPQAAHAYATGKFAQLRHILFLAAAFLGLTFGGLCLLVLMTGDWLMVLVFGPLYQGTGAILVILAVTTLMASMGMVVGSGLRAIDQPRSNFVADFVCMVVTLVTAAFLILPYGALGAAIATLAGTSTSAIVRMLILARHLALMPAHSTAAATDTGSRIARHTRSTSASDAPPAEIVEIP